MDVEETLERLQGARDLCPSPIDQEMLGEAIEAIEYLQNVVERLDEWINDYAYDSNGFKF
jgi:hypothetical protein